MSKISIDLDLSVVQKALHAKVQPAVDKILSGYDLSAMIVKELERPVADSDPYNSMQRYLMLQMYRGQGNPEPVIVQMIRSAIHDAAQAYVKANLAKQKDNIQAAFKKMIAGSSDKLAKTFLGCVEGALGSDWRFELNTTASVKEPERDYD